MNKRKNNPSAGSDNPEWSDKDFARARPAREVVPEIVDSYKRTRGKQKAPTKVAVSSRLDEDVVAAYQADGKGWQGRVNETLRGAMTDGTEPGARKGSNSVAEEGRKPRINKTPKKTA